MAEYTSRPRAVAIHAVLFLVAAVVQATSHAKAAEPDAEVPVAPYLSSVLVQEPTKTTGVTLPIRTTLKVGTLSRPTRWPGGPSSFTGPIFVIGSDPTSIRWLSLNREQLSRIGAVGILVQADSKRDLTQVLTLAQGLPVAPVQSTWVEQRLHSIGAGVIPVLIHADGRVTQ